MSSAIAESPQQPRGVGALRRLQRKGSRSSLANKMAAAVSGLSGQLDELRDNTSKFDLPALLSEKVASLSPSTLVSQPVVVVTDEDDEGGAAAAGPSSMSLTEFLASAVPTPTRTRTILSRKARPAPQPLSLAEVDADLLRALDAVTNASVGAGADVRTLRVWRNAVHTAMLTLAESHPTRTAAAAAAAQRKASTPAVPHRIRRKPAPKMTNDDECALSSHDSGWTRTEVDLEAAGWTTAHDTSSLSSPSSFASTSSHIDRDKTKPTRLSTTAPRSSSFSHDSAPEWTLAATMPQSPITPTARRFSHTTQACDINILQAMRLDSMLMGIRGSLTYSDVLDEPQEDEDEDEGEDIVSSLGHARQASISSSVDDAMATPELGYASSITSSSQDEEEPRRSAQGRRSSSSSLTPGKPSSSDMPLRPIRSPDRCRVRVPEHVKSAVRDQRWQPFTAAGTAEEDDDDDEEDDLRPYGAPLRRKKDNTMDMLDFLNSGPPM